MTRRVLLLGGVADGMWVTVGDDGPSILVSEGLKFSPTKMQMEPQPLHEHQVHKLSDKTGSYWVGTPYYSDASVMKTLLDGYQAKGGS